MATQPTRENILQAIQQYGEDGQHFQSREIREQLQIGSTDTNAAAAIHNLIKSLERDGIIEEVPTGRKRNKFFRLSTPHSKANTPTVEAPALLQRGAKPAPDRLTRMEQRLASLDSKMDQVLEALGLKQPQRRI